MNIIEVKINVEGMVHSPANGSRDSKSGNRFIFVCFILMPYLYLYAWQCCVEYISAHLLVEKD